MEQTKQHENDTQPPAALTFDLGTFEGFSFADQSAIDRTLTADEVVAWDHDSLGEAEFWPAGDHHGVAAVFSGQSAVTCSELLALDRLLVALGDDSNETYCRVVHALNHGERLEDLTPEAVEDDPPFVFFGSSFFDLRREAAYELFELFYPEAYALWERGTCDGLIFDTDRFLDSPGFGVEELDFGDQKALIISPK